jgi:hypothetical protein
MPAQVSRIASPPASYLRERGYAHYACAVCGGEQTGSTIHAEFFPTYDPRTHCGKPMVKTWRPEASDPCEKWSVFRKGDDWRIPAKGPDLFGPRFVGSREEAEAEAELWNGAVFTYEARHVLREKCPCGWSKYVALDGKPVRRLICPNCLRKNFAPETKEQ